jgi:hypothetical protein
MLSDLGGNGFSELPKSHLVIQTFLQVLSKMRNYLRCVRLILRAFRLLRVLLRPFRVSELECFRGGGANGAGVGAEGRVI